MYLFLCQVSTFDFELTSLVDGGIAYSMEDKISQFRRLPVASELSQEDKVVIKDKGLRAWLVSQEDRDWDKVAEAAALMKMAGYEVKDIAKVCGVSVKELEAKVNLEKADSAVALEAMQGMLYHIRNKDKKMIEFFFKHRMGWSEKKDINVSGEIGVKPIINIGLSNGQKISVDGVGTGSKLPDIECSSN